MSKFSYVESTEGLASAWGEWLDLRTFFSRFLGLSSLFGAVFASNSYLFDSVKLLLLGSIIETGRRLCQWLMERFRFQYSMTAEFNEGDPTYEWIVNFLTQEHVWRRSREFRVSAKSSRRRWGIRAASDPHVRGNADYVPTYELPQLFRWNGHWIEIKRDKGYAPISPYGPQSTATIFVTIYTLDLAVMSALVEEARLRYIEVSRPNVIIHMADMPQFGHHDFLWSNTKRKVKRPLNSIILQEGMIESLVQDAKEFLESEDWYIEAGIPHRRGYLLYGPPGTGKSSTIYALAGELGLEIYSVSLASGFVDDSFLQRATTSIPKGSILLIEDIDCCFSREDEEEQETYTPGYPIMPLPIMPPGRRKSPVSLSALLNVIDGVGSEDGKLFFATTNYIDRLDPALLRPGRIDRKIQYHLATNEQASALFTRFFPESRFSSSLSDAGIGMSKSSQTTTIKELAEEFAAGIPEHEFSTAEIQGYLLSHKKEPLRAVEGILSWVEIERTLRKEREAREALRKERARQAKEKRENANVQPNVSGSPGPQTAPFSPAPSRFADTCQPTDPIARESTSVSSPQGLKIRVNGSSRTEVGDGSSSPSPG